MSSGENVFVSLVRGIIEKISSDQGINIKIDLSHVEESLKDNEFSDLLAQARSIIDKLLPVRIVVAGQTGVGKSTLVNAVFGEDLAPSGHGRPITQCAQWYSTSRYPIEILDTKGLELKDFEETSKAIEREIANCRLQSSVADQIHLAWILIAEGSSRVQQAEIDLARMIVSNEVPTIIAITKATGDDTFIESVKSIFAEENIAIKDVIAVNSIPGRFVPTHGIDSLVEVSYRYLPEGVEAAFASAQKTSFPTKRKQAEKYVQIAASAAAVVGATPIPFSDAALLAPVQISMIYGISRAYGINETNDVISSVVMSVSGVLALSFAGRAVVSGILKLIPGIGSVAGGTISAITARQFTSVFGGLYIDFIEDQMKTNKRLPGPEDLKELGNYIKSRLS